MQRKFQIIQIILSASAACVLALSAPAQDAVYPKTDDTEATRERTMMQERAERLNDAIRASDILGMHVKNYQNQKLGKVEDLTLDMKSGRIIQVILSKGGLFGAGGTLTAVPPAALHRGVSVWVLLLDASTEKLEGAPPFDESSLEAGGQANGNYVQKASKLIGMPVRNLQNEKLGSVQNFILDLSAGRIIAVIISPGGFIGMSRKLDAVAATALRFNAERDGFQLDESKDMFANAPHFKVNEWPDLSESIETTTNAENTARNVRDRDHQTLTPLDQGNSQADLDITAQIRKEIIAEKEISLNARNVKIITIGGRVTLRGPVNTADEKRLIGGIADRIAQSGNVDNQLEVKISTGSKN